MSVAVVRYYFELSDLENMWFASGIEILSVTITITVTTTKL